MLQPVKDEASELYAGIRSSGANIFFGASGKRRESTKRTRAELSVGIYVQ